MKTQSTQSQGAPSQAIQSQSRQSAYPVDPQFLSRWSPRAYDQADELSTTNLMTILEAARWAPSAYNVQPWRFLYAKRNDANWAAYLTLLDPFNAEWARRSGALVFLISSKTVPSSEPPREFPSHSFDAGAAWIHMALQAQKLGYHAHAIGGFYQDAAREALAIPDTFKIEVGIAIGKIASAEILSESMRAREVPSSRKPLAELVFAGRYSQ